MKFITLILLLNLFSCATPTTKSENLVSLSHESIMATNWYQTSGEARALYYQGYQLASLNFLNTLSKKTNKPKAVVVDIDETILDNSPYQAKIIQTKSGYPQHWEEWINASKAEALPGSLDFLKLVDSKKVEVFYISNRKLKDRRITFELLKKLKFPVKSEEQILVQTDSSDKSDRRNNVASRYEIVILVGDNLNDFTGLFENKTNDEKKLLVDGMKDEFGRRFIILPNPLYGDWEGALYNYNYRIPDAEKHNLRMEALKSF